MTLDSIKQSIKQEPYFECEDGLLYCADCMDILPQLPDKCIPLLKRVTRSLIAFLAPAQPPLPPSD